MVFLYLLSVVELLLLLVGRTTAQQSCLVPADSQNRLIPFRDDNDSPVLPSGTQAIITSYQFQCCGNITEWRTFVQPGGSNHRDGIYSIRFQVWRPSPAVATDGCYSLVGENVFPSVALIDNNGGEGEVSETPALTNIISFQPGDVVGYFTQSDGFSVHEGIQLDVDYTDESVWYHTNTDDDDLVGPGGSCPFPVGTEPGETLTSSTNAAPVLSVSYAIFPCPSSTLPTVMMTASEDPIKPTPISAPTLTGISSPVTTPPPLTSTPVPTTSIRASPTSPPATDVGNGSSSPVVLASAGAAVGLVIILLVAVTLVAVCTAKVRRKNPKYNIHPPATSNTLNMEIQKNDAYVTTIPDHTHNSDELYASINEEDVKMQGNDAYSTSRHIPVDANESYATTISTDLNQAYAIHDMNTSHEQQEPDEYDYV